MAKYEIDGKEVTEEEFNKQVFKAVEESPFFLDEIVSVSFSGEKKDEEEILKGLREAIQNGISSGGYDFKLPVSGTISHTGGTVFEKVQDSTINPYSVEGQIKSIIKLAEKIKSHQGESVKGINADPMANNIWQRPHKEDHHNITFDIPKSAKKETEGKLFYELDFEFIEQMAERMQSNKDNDKYEKWNWKKPMTPKGIEDLKQAMWRHIIEVMQGNYTDDGRIYGHLEAISNNAMMINYQLKNK